MARFHFSSGWQLFKTKADSKYSSKSMDKFKILGIEKGWETYLSLDLARAIGIEHVSKMFVRHILGQVSHK